MTNFIQTLKNLKYMISTHSDGRMIAKTTRDVQEHQLDGLDLKGVILSTNDSGTHVVAPGCNVPLEEPNAKATISGYSTGRDGIMYRFYQYQGEWTVSTSGRIVPDTFWGPKGTPTFQELVQQAVTDKLVDYSKLVPGYCYYAILETPDFTNLVKHDELRLTLVDMIDVRTGVRRPLDQDEGFTEHLELLEHQPEIKPSEGLIEGNLGFAVHYSDGSSYREWSVPFHRASELRPNLSDPIRQWIALRKRGRSVEIEEFLQFFPWHREQFTQLQEVFQSLVDIIHDNYCTRKLGPPHHTRYMEDLVYDSRTVNRALSREDVVAHLLRQDIKRIHYLLRTGTALTPQTAPNGESASGSVV